jgi:hypothetical protein
MRDRCPPHRFEGGWVNDEEGGVIFCRWCGEIRSLAPQRIEAPLEEWIVNAGKQAPDKRTD